MTEIAVFSVWATIRLDAKREFRRWMAIQMGWREIDVFRLFGVMVDEGKPMELFRNLGWLDAQRELTRLPSFVEPGTAQLTVSPFSPEGNTWYCVTHSLHTWSGGCPVCDDNYIRGGYGDGVEAS